MVQGTVGMGGGGVKVLDLFSGIGGFSLGLERAGFETIAFCEIDPFCQKVLKKHWPDVPIYEDVRELTAERLEQDGIEKPNVITGGYPCQPFSVAGKRQGEADDRHLWPEVARLIQEFNPDWFIGENVAGHITMGLDEVLSDLEGLGYAARPIVIPACAVDADHRRDRIWIVAHSKSIRHGKGRRSEDVLKAYGRSYRQVFIKPGESGENVANSKRMRELQQEGGEQDQRRWAGNSSEVLANANGNNAQRQQPRCHDSKNGEDQGERQTGFCGGARHWEAEPAVGRVANGIPRRVDRLRALGNAVVPQIPEIIGRAIKEAA